jgi:TIR domain
MQGFIESRESLPKGITRIFISHKQQDRNEALRVGWLANKAGHYFWLDVLDPTLASGHLNPIQTAAVIEMALLNCTHVIALITPRSEKSRWIPYEYGRVKEPLPYSLNAASWLHPRTQFPIPEYLYLGALTNSEKGIMCCLSPQQPPISWSRPWPPALP